MNVVAAKFSPVCVINVRSVYEVCFLGDAHVGKMLYARYLQQQQQGQR